MTNQNNAAQAADKLPHWEEISAKLERDETLTPLELFIHENEPAGGDADAWRDQLSDALASAPVAGEAQPTWDDLKSLAVKHSVWVPGYGPFAAELLATYGLAPAEQPHWLAAWLNTMNHAAPQANAKDVRNV
ncbi:TPA: hypothetical protein ACKRM8_006072 [Pseudomonas aeruginosa]